MSVPLTGTGGFFTRQGAFIGEVNRVASAFYASALDAGFQSIWVQFASSDAAAVQNLPAARDSFRTSDAGYLATVIGDGQQAAILQTNDDAPLVPSTFQQALNIIVLQMKAQGQFVNQPTLTAVVTAGTNTSDTVVMVSTVNRFGDQSDMTYAETVTATVTAATGGASFAGTLTAVGAPVRAATDPFWPGGSGCNVGVPIIDPGTNTLVADGIFANWTNTNTPVSWQTSQADPGVITFQVPGGGVRTGSNAAKLLSDGASLSELYQVVNVQPNTVYAFVMNILKSDAGANGTFRVRWTDGNGNTVGTTLLTTISTLSTSYTVLKGFLNTPNQLPVVTQFRIGYSVAPTAGKFVEVALVGLTAATQLYSQGPYMAAFGNTIRPAVSDVWSCVFTNTLTSKSFVRGFDRLYSMRTLKNSQGKELYFQSSGIATIPDSLVTN